MSFVPFIPMIFEIAGGEAGLAILGSIGLGLGSFASLKGAQTHYTVGSKRPEHFGSRPYGQPPSKVPRLDEIEGIGQLPKHRRPGAPTETEEENENSFPQTMSDNQVPLLQDSLSVSHPKEKLHGDPIRHYRVDSFISDAEEGTEQMIALGVLGTRDHWITSTGAGANTFLQTPVAWFNLDPNQGIPAGIHYPARTVATEQMLVLDHVTQIFEFVNLGNTPTFCMLQAFKVVEGTSNTVLAQAILSYNAVAAGAPDNAFAFPAAATLPSGADYGTQGITAGGEGLPWAQTFVEGKTFTQVYKDLKKWRFQLPAGGRICLKLSVKHGMVGDRGDITDGLLYPKGCLAYVFSNFGAAVLSSVSALPTHANSKVGVVVTSMMRFRHLERKIASDKRLTKFYNVVANNPPASETFIDTDLDDVSIVIQA